MQEASWAAAAGADAVGLNFYRPSPRCVDLGRAREIVAVLPPNVTPVAVLVRPNPQFLERLRDEVGPVTFQLHDVDLALLAPTLQRLRAPVLFTVPVANRDDVDKLALEISRWQGLLGDLVQAVLVDAKSTAPDVHGGTGTTVPWSLLSGLVLDLPLVLAGGLNPVNVAAAIAIVLPMGVDVASGVESAPGVKDEAKMRHFVVAARGSMAKRA